MTQRRAVRVASEWSACGMPGCDTCLYEFASWDGRVMSEEHRQRCCRELADCLAWVVEHRQKIARGEYPEHDLREFADLVNLERFILTAKVRPIQRAEMGRCSGFREHA